jgi:hypothetical protein
VNEDDLFRAMAKPARERRKCACHGDIVADPNDQEEIASAIRADRLTEQHQLWRDWQIGAGLLLSDDELDALTPKLRKVG